MRAWILLLACLEIVASVMAVHPIAPKIVGGVETTIEQYPFAAALLNSWGGIIFSQACGGTIINNRAILTAAHCFMFLPSPFSWRIRVGSSSASIGGAVHNVGAIIIHPNFVLQTFDNDIAIMHVTTAFTFNDQVRVGTIGGSDYNVADNTIVMAIGWGDLWFDGPGSDHLRRVQIWTVNQEVCRARFAELGNTITDNMLCSGWLDVGGRDQCQGDSGGPLLHNHVVIGVCSWGEECALARYPGVNARVSRYTSWIQSNA